MVQKGGDRSEQSVEKQKIKKKNTEKRSHNKEKQSKTHTYRQRGKEKSLQ